MPKHAAEVLLDPTSMNYLVPFPEIFVGMAQQAPAIVEAHRSGGGVSWDEFGKEVRESQAAFNRAMFMAKLGTEYLPSITDVHTRLTESAAPRVAVPDADADR